MRHGYFFRVRVRSRVPEPHVLPPASTGHALALYACGPTPTTDLTTPRPHSSCARARRVRWRDGLHCNAAAGRRRWPPPPSRCRQRSRTAPRHWVGTCPPSSWGFFCGFAPPEWRFRRFGRAQNFCDAIASLFRAFALKLRKNRLLPTHDQARQPTHLFARCACVANAPRYAAGQTRAQSAEARASG